MLKGAGSRVRSLLALPLTSQARCLQENYEHFKPAGIDGCIFTKLDECFSLGQAMSIAAVTRLPIHMVTDGPHIPDDIHFPNAKKMVRLAEQMARMAQTRWQTSEVSSAMNNNFMQHGV
jgi:flagellar biosynthesis protein FlhF